MQSQVLMTLAAFCGKCCWVDELLLHEHDAALRAPRAEHQDNKVTTIADDRSNKAPEPGALENVLK
jgi:hypothetical protein